MSQLKRNVIAASLAAAGMFAVVAPSVAATSAPQEIKVKSTVGSYMDWKRVDGVEWTEAMQLTFVRKGTTLSVAPFEIDTLVKPNSAGKKVSFILKEELKLTNTNSNETIENFDISVGGKKLEPNQSVEIVSTNESGVVGVGKVLRVTKNSTTTIPYDIETGKYVGYTSIVLEGEA